MKQLRTKSLALLSILLSTVFFWYVYAVDTTYNTFDTQSATWLWSNNSVISTENYPRPSGSGAYYINKWNNSSIIGNYFEWYYYDSVFGYFKVDQSPNQSENVRIVGSTWICPSDYGYRLGGYSYSEDFGYIDFDYDSNTFVYYCVDDWELHWYAYSSLLWYQNFEGITFDINVEATIVEAEEPTWTGAFVNDETDITEESPDEEQWESWESEFNNSNFNYDTIQNDLLEFDGKYESLFYIIK